MYIAIDTSTEIAGLALAREDGIIAELAWRCGQDHTVHLLPNLAHLLDQAGLTPQGAKGVIVARGPGSYNGLRVGMSTAKGLAFSLGIPLVGISTLEAEAYQHAGYGFPVCPVLNAGRGEIATAVYRSVDGKWSQLMPEHLGTVEALCAEIKGRTVFCGEFVPAIADRLKEALGEKAVMLSAAANWRRAGFLAELGMRRLQSGDHDNPVTLQPLYLRGPAITQAKHR